MRLNFELFKYKSLYANITVTDGKDKGSFNISNSYNGDSYTALSTYLNIGIRNKEKGMNERCVLSFFDIYALHKIFRKLLKVLEADFYEVVEHVEEGEILIIKPEYRKSFAYTSKSGGRIAFKPVIMHRKEIQEPCIKVYINEIDVYTVLEVDRIEAILYNLLNIDIQSYALQMVNLHFNEKLISREMAKAYRKSVTME